MEVKPRGTSVIKYPEAAIKKACYKLLVKDAWGVWYMKKMVYVFVLSCLLTMSLCACGSDKKETGNKVDMDQKIKEVKLIVKMHAMVEEINDVMETVKMNDMVEIINEFNQNSDTGEIKLYQDCGWSEYELQYYVADNPALHVARDNTAQYYGFMYPENSGRVCYTQLRLMDKKYHVFGINVGDTLSEAIEVVEGYGYSEESFPLENCVMYAKEDVHIFIDYEQEKIDEITVSLYEEREDEEEGIMY